MAESPRQAHHGRNPMPGEKHRSDRIGWLRAAVLGANDGLISTSSLVVGVAAAEPDRAAILLAAVAGLAAGALSMAAGEYVSVSSQADTENADLARERGELADNARRPSTPSWPRSTSPGGSTPSSRSQVADQLTAHDALGAHARDELGIHETHARPPDPGRGRLRGRLRGRGGAARDSRGAAAVPVLTPGIVGVTLVLLARARRRRGPPRRRPAHAGCAAGRVLGRGGHGVHRRWSGGSSARSSRRYL